MSRDWNIVDDEVAEPVDEPDETRLNRNRIRLIALERRSRERLRQWRIGTIALGLIVVAALNFSAAKWFGEGRHHRLAFVALAAAIALFVGLLRKLNAVRRSARQIAAITIPLQAERIPESASSAPRG